MKETAERLMGLAAHIRNAGYAGFSFRDLAAEDRPQPGPTRGCPAPPYRSGLFLITNSIVIAHDNVLHRTGDSGSGGLNYRSRQHPTSRPPSLGPNHAARRAHVADSAGYDRPKPRR